VCWKWKYTCLAIICGIMPPNMTKPVLIHRFSLTAGMKRKETIRNLLKKKHTWEKWDHIPLLIYWKDFKSTNETISKVIHIMDSELFRI
jgi:hypothetical protein